MSAESGRQASPAQSAHQASDCARALGAAITQIELALREAHPPVGTLGTLIDRMGKTLGALRTARYREMATGSTIGFCDEMESSIEQLQKDLSGGIRQLQFYDRMVQHLSHVQDYLFSMANQLASEAASGGVKEEAWDTLRERLHARLISDAQRELLDIVLPPSPAVRAARRVERGEHSPHGSVELF